MADRPSFWCILTMSPGRTLPVAKALTEAGFTVWTPAEERARLAGRNRRLVEQACAITPSFVFADYEQRLDLAALSRSPSKLYRVWDGELRRMVEHGVPHFSVFRHQGAFPRVTDVSLQPLRTIEERLRVQAQRRQERARRKGSVPQFSAGEFVRVTDGPFGGLDLEVVAANTGKMVEVTYPGWVRPMAICAWTLREVQSMHADAAA